MTSRDSASSEITPDVLLRAYACGIFPMAESADDPTLFWVEPELRGVIPARGLSHRLAARAHRAFGRFPVTVEHRFQGDDRGCAAPQAGREDTWINKRIRDLYGGPARARALATASRSGRADDLVGGLYGVSLGRAFFGESMFHTAPRCLQGGAGASGARLIAGGFELLDTQYVTEHLRSFGAVEIPRRRYTALLDNAIKGAAADFAELPVDAPVSGARALEIITGRG
jgi:leucyl/phenylalanyl-tRNA--protein transferase